jgi:hypothetical protein
VTEKLLVAVGRPLWGAEIDGAVSDELTYLPTEPVAEPRTDLLLRTPQYLRAVLAAAKTPGQAVSEAQIRETLRRMPGLGRTRLGVTDYFTARTANFWKAPPDTDLNYWLTWAAAARFLTKDAGGYQMAGDGSRLAGLPARAKGAVRAALTAGRPSTPEDG